MNNQEVKITPIKNSEDHNKVVAKYEEEVKAQKQKSLDWENACYKKDETILELQKAQERAEKEAQDWKNEAHAARKVQAESKHTKEAQDFETEFKKSQLKKGWQWSESQGWVKAN